MSQLTLYLDAETLPVEAGARPNDNPDGSPGQRLPGKRPAHVRSCIARSMTARDSTTKRF
jgi:hypothetical protein